MDYRLLKECRENIKLEPETQQKIIAACNSAEKSTVLFKKPVFRKLCRTAVAACIIFFIAIPATAGYDWQFYSLLYSFMPERAEFFSPVELSCEDNGIKMEVVASYIHDDSAEIYIAITDLIGGRIDETIDLFDSYDINTIFDTEAYCEKVSYNADTSTATFLVTVIQDNGLKLKNEKITFSLKQILCGKQQYEGVIENYEMGSITDRPETRIMDIVSCGSADKLLFEKYSRADKTEMLVPQGVLAQPTDGVTLTAAGYIGDELHIQVKYDDVKHTDNHGFIYLKDKERGQLIRADANISTNARDNCSSYEEYIFTGILPENAGRYSIYGEFVTGNTLLTGNWKVSFKVKSE